MKKVFNIFATSLMVLTVASCSLEELPKTSIALTEGEDLIQTTDNLSQFENELHRRYRACQQGSPAIAEEVQMDGFNATMWFGNNYGPIHRSNSDFSSGDTYVEAAWQNYYWAINQCNLILDNTKEPSETLVDLVPPVRGYAYFYRAACYLYLVRHFAKAYDASTAETELGVPVVTTYDQTARPARNTVAEVYAQIKQDLDEANELIGGIAGSVRAGKPTGDAVKAMYARYYLDTKDYENAASYSDEIINSEAGYALANSAELMQEEFRNDNGTEPILQYYASQNELPNGMGSFTSASYTEDQGLYFAPYYLPSKKLLDNYEATDLRLACWFDNTVKIRNSGSYIENSGVYVFTRFLGNPALYTTQQPQSYQCVKPFTLSEAYLIAAEAYYFANDAEKAQARLNTLQRARAASASSATLENIQREWTRETIGTCQRLAAYKRWGLGFENRTAQAAALLNNMLMVTGSDYAERNFPASDSRWVWPIPKSEIQANTNLKQNNGY